MEYPRIIYDKTHGVIKLAENYVIEGYVVPKGFSPKCNTSLYMALKLVTIFCRNKFMPFLIIYSYLCENNKYIRAVEISQDVLFAIETSNRTKFMMFLINKYHGFKYGRNI